MKLHALGQSIPAGLEVTRPEPLPVKLTARRASPGGGGGTAEKAARTSRSALIGTSQAAVPEHAPCQPSNFQPVSGRATRWMVVDPSTVWVQSDRQEKLAARTSTASDNG